MTHAYDKILVDRAADSLGRMLDYSAYSLHYDISAMTDLFIASGVAGLFENGDIRIITGMSGIELSYEVLEKSGIIFERAQPRYTKSLSPEFWYGYTLARIQWETGLPFDHLVRSFSPQTFISDYVKKRLSFLNGLPFDISDKDRSAGITAMSRQYADESLSFFISTSTPGINSAAKEETPLKQMRIKNGLSQSGLSKASGVPLRTIQQYEQRQKDLAKARAEYLIALSRALNCDPSPLI